jgi:hypothetical protein
MAVIDLPLALRILGALRGKEAGEEGQMRRPGRNPADIWRDLMDDGRCPFGLLGEEPLHVDRGMHGALAESAETKASY